MAMQPKTWVKKAAQKKSKVTIHDPKLIQVQGDPAGKTVATDRNRIHIYDGNLGFDAIEDYPDWRVATDTNDHAVQGTLTKIHLLSIAETAKAFITKDQSTVILRLEIHPNALRASYHGQHGDGSCILQTGQEWLGYKPVQGHFEASGLTTVTLNPQFVIDALKGFAPKDDIISFAIPASQLFVVFEQAEYKALIAQMRE